MNNDIVKIGNDFEVRKPLSFEQFKQRYMRQIDHDEIDTVLSLHGIDLTAEVELVHLQQYDLYLKRFQSNLE